MDGKNPNKELDVSIIVPLYNEEESIRALYDAILSAADTIGIEYEIVFVDDGSRDETFELANELAQYNNRLRVVKFRRNYGQTPAMAAGIDYSRGKILVTMDGDLQNDPTDINLFLDKINEGYDLVVGWRHKRQDKLITRKIPSKIANWIIGKVTGVPIKDNGCSLKAYKADIIKSVPLYSEMHRFIPAMTSLTGAKYAEIKVKHHARQFGVSKYGLSRIYKVILDLLAIKTLISFSHKPLLWFSILALPVATLSVIAIVHSLIGLIAGNSDNNLIVTAGVGILCGALTFFLILCGALGELISKTGDMRLNKLCSLTSKKVEPKG